MSRGERKAMITRDAPELSLSRQCRLLSIGRLRWSQKIGQGAKVYSTG